MTDKTDESAKLELIEAEELNKSIILPEKQKTITLEDTVDPEKLAGHIAIVGASAGGLNALEQLFSPMPPDIDIAFVIVMHLSKNYVSRLDTILANQTELPVHFVQHDSRDVSLVAGNIYILREPENYIFDNGKLCLDKYSTSVSRIPHHSIDRIMTAAAKDLDYRTIGLILSGSGRDGSEGIATIVEANGFVLAQKPSTAEHRSMPEAAISTGLVDQVVPCEDMANLLLSYVNHPFIRYRQKSQVLKHREILSDILHVLHQHSGIDFSLYKIHTVARRIERRVSINHQNSLKAYYEYILENPKELQKLVQELLINVTQFFRDQVFYEQLEKNIIPDLVASCPPDHDFRVWSAGCSTGEEAYSLAILFREVLDRAGRTNKVKVFATDLDDDSLAKASRGTYPISILEPIGKEKLMRWFTPIGERYEINSSIRQSVVFARHNLIEDPPFSKMDFIACRNLLIYLNNDTQQNVLSSLKYALRGDGILFIGPSENLGECAHYFDIINKKANIYKKCVVPKPNIDELPQHRYSGRNNSFIAVRSLLDAREEFNKQPRSQAFKEKLNKMYVPPCIVVNQQHHAIHAYGDLSPFVKPPPSGEITSSIKNIVNDGLVTPISTALARSNKEGQPIIYQNISLETTKEEEKSEFVNLTVHKIIENEGSNNKAIYYAIIFEKVGKANKDPNTSRIDYDHISQAQMRIEDLENELVRKQEHLQVIIEELETSNEELQSSNEELQSSNEELQSTNEELQSVNEELHTVNGENEERIHELTELNNDFDNLINSTAIGIIFLDENLLIRKYTPPVEKFFNIRSDDIGRPIHHFSHSLRYDDLIKDIINVNDNSNTLYRDVGTQSGRHLTVRISPYINKKGRQDLGVVLSFSDITHINLVESALRNARKQLTYKDLELNDLTHLALSPIKILLIDDSDEDRKILRRHIDGIGSLKCDILEATGTNDLADLLENRDDFDICLLDYKLSGETAADLIYHFPVLRKMPLIVLSGMIEENMKDAMNTASYNSIYDFIDKRDLNENIIQTSIVQALKAEAAENY